MVIWVNPSLGQNRRFLELVAPGADANLFGVALDVTATASNKVSAYRVAASTGNQALSSVAMVASAWQHCAAVFASGASAAAYLNGGNKGISGTALAPVGITGTLMSGRASDFSFGIGGQAAHAAVYGRGLSDTEVAYLGLGGNPRAIKGVVNYWKLLTTGGVAATPVVDEIGTNDLTPSATMGAGTTFPAVQTFMTGGPVGNLNYVSGTPITSINLGTSGTAPLFDEVSSAHTATLKQLGSAVSIGTTTAAGTALREIPLNTLGAFAAGDYLKITSGGTPTLVLAVNVTASTVLVATDQTFANAAAVFRLPVNAMTVAGCGITSNIFSGTPVAAATSALCFFRATNAANSALTADTDLFTITITAGGGGGGGGGLMSPAGFFSGGFSGG
jgi:hypothetical protein